jgi:hypothetical protein
MIIAALAEEDGGRRPLASHRHVWEQREQTGLPSY